MAGTVKISELPAGQKIGNVSGALEIDASGNLKLNPTSGTVQVPSGVLIDFTGSSPVSIVSQSRETGFAFPNYITSAHGQQYWTTNNTNYANLIYQGGSILALGSGNGTSANGGTLLVDNLSTNANDLSISSATTNINFNSSNLTSIHNATILSTLKLDYGSGTHNLAGSLLGVTIDGGNAGGGNLNVFNVVTTAIANTIVGSGGTLVLSTGGGSGADIKLNPGSGGALNFTGANVLAKSILQVDASNNVNTVNLGDGQLLIGSSGNSPLVGTITAGSGINVTTGSGTITVSTIGAGFTWTTVTGTSQAMSAENGYISNNASLVTLTLPVTAAVGDEVEVIGLGAGGWLIAQNAGQLIHLGSSTTTTGVGGSLASTNANDRIIITCIVANTTFSAYATGNTTVVQEN